MNALIIDPTLTQAIRRAYLLDKMHAKAQYCAAMGQIYTCCCVCFEETRFWRDVPISHYVCEKHVNRKQAIHQARFWRLVHQGARRAA